MSEHKDARPVWLTSKWDFSAEETPFNPGSLDAKRWTDSTVLTCPNCGSAYTHLNRAYYQFAEKADEAAPVPGAEFGGHVKSGERRSRGVLLFGCEQCPDAFELIFQQHKGETFVLTRKVTRKTDYSSDGRLIDDEREWESRR